MEKNKKKIILAGAALLIVIVIIVVCILFKDKMQSAINNNTSKVVLSLSGESQAAIDNEIKANLENNKYSLEKAVVYQNPYKNSPLSAMLTFYTEKKVSVEVIIKGKNNDDLNYKYEKENNYHYIPIFGLYDDYNNEITINLSNGDTKKFNIKTEKIQLNKEFEVNVNEIKDDNIYFISSPISMDTFGMDSYGNIRWYSSNLYHSVENLGNGHLLIGTNSFNDSGLSTELLEIDYLGRIYNRYSINSGYLNDYFVKENGNIILTSKSPDRLTYSDIVLEIDKNTGKVVKTIDIYEIFKNIDTNFVDNLEKEYFFNSGIKYNEQTDELLLTYWGGEFVINLDYSDSTINWIFSNPENFTSSFSQYLLISVDGTYPKSMHSATLEGNTLKVFDNGYSINKREMNIPALKGSYSSANTYEINGKAIQLKSTYDETKENFSYALADYEITNDSEVILYGRELNNINYDIEQPLNEYFDLKTRITEYKEGKKVLDINFSGASYSVNKIKFNNSYTFDFIDEKILTTLEPVEGEKLSEDIINSIKSTSEELAVSIGYDKGYLEHNMILFSKDTASIILVNEKYEGQLFTIKEENVMQINRLYVDIKPGKYNIYMLYNDIYYNTNQYIEVK